MDWYWWALIGVGVILIGYVKLKVFMNWMRKKSGNHEEDE